jgi:hypothetical protein
MALPRGSLPGSDNTGSQFYNELSQNRVCVKRVDNLTVPFWTNEPTDMALPTHDPGAITGTSDTFMYVTIRAPYFEEVNLQVYVTL